MRHTVDDPSTWAVNTFKPTLPLQEVEQHLADEAVRVVIMRGGNRCRKTTGMVWIGTKACLGGYSWAPEVRADDGQRGVNVLLVSKAMHTASTSIQEPLQRFMLRGLPTELVVRRTTTKELTTPVRFANDSRLDIKTEEMGWEKLQGGGYNLSGIDEFPVRQPWKELAARARAGCPYKRMVGFTPTDGPDGWFNREVIEPAERGERTGIRIVFAAVFSNGDPGCKECGLGPAAWNARLKTLGLRRTFEHHWELKKLCWSCHAFGIDQAIDNSVILEWEEEYEGNELGIRLYGEFLDVRGTKCFAPEEIKALLSGCHNGTSKAGMKFWPRNDHEPQVGGVDAAEGLGPKHSETVASFFSGGYGVQTGLFACDRTQYHDYRETIDWMATEPFGMGPADDRLSANLVIERKNMGVALIGEYKERPHLVVYHQRKVHARTHEAGVVWGWVSHHESRDNLFRDLFSAIRKNLTYHKDGRVTFNKEKFHPRGIVIRDRVTIEQLKHLYYDTDRGNRISKPAGRRDDRVLAAALANEGRMHRQIEPDHTPEKMTPYRAWLEAFLSTREVTDLPPTEWVEQNGVLVPSPW